MTKKEHELRLLERFRELCPECPQGFVCLHEEPDFLLPSASSLLGIELVQWFCDANRSDGGSPSRQQESLSFTIVRKAQDIYSSTASPPVDVSVHFNAMLPLTRREVEHLPGNIAAIVRKYQPGPERHRRLDWPDEGWRDLPETIVSISLLKPINEREVVWAPEGGGALPVVTTEHIREAIRSKEPRLPAYRKAAQEIWLLVVAAGWSASGFCKIAPEPERCVVETEFDAVYFLQFSDREVVHWPVVRAPDQ